MTPPESTQILLELRERLVRVETKVDAISTTPETARTALNKAEGLEEDVAELKDQQRWLNRTSWAAVVAVAGQLVIMALR